MHKRTNKNCLGFIETQCKLDCPTAVFVLSRNALGGEEWRVVLRDDTKNGCVAD